MTDFDLDALLEEAVLHGALSEGRAPHLAAAQFGAAQAIAAARATADRHAPNGWANGWTAAETAFLGEAAGVLSDAEIAARLGRSVAAVHVRRTRRALPGPLVHPDYVTGQGMAHALGIDGHSIIKLIERGLLPAEIAPVSGPRFWRMRRAAFVAWALRPENWPYFYRSVRRPERLGDGKLRRLIVHRAARWIGPDGQRDEWWTTGEVARYHGVDSQDVTRYLYRGLLPSAVRWSNWLVRRSDATRPGLRFYKGKGEGQFELFSTPALDAFLVLTVAVGIPATQIARLVGGISHATPPGRVLALHRRGRIPWLIRAYELPVLHRADAPGDGRSVDGLLWADWRPLAHRFRRLAGAWPRAAAGELRAMAARRDHNLVNGVLRAGVAWNLGPEHPLMRGLLYRMRAAEVEAFGLWDGWAAKR